MTTPPEDALLELQQTLQPYLPILTKANQMVLDQDVSNYPIFIYYQADDMELGLPVIQEPEKNWTIHISTLEELVARSILERAKVDDFRKLYKSKAGHLCLLVWRDTGAQFVFLPQQ